MFQPDVDSNAGEAFQVYNDLRAALRDLGVEAQEVGDQQIVCDFSPSGTSYDPISVRLSFPEGNGILVADGLLLPLEEPATEGLRIALNYLNSELYTFSFFLAETGAGPEVMVRQTLLPNLDQGALIHPRELQHALTGLCAQKAIFAGPLSRVQEGHSWRFVKEALKAVR